MSFEGTKYRTTFPGGLISIDALRSVAELSMARGDNTLSLSSCQQFELRLAQTVEASAPAALAYLERKETRAAVPMSTAGVVEFERSHKWLSLGAFQEILEAIPPTKNITVGVSDSRQPYLPIYLGDVILIASGVPYYWNVVVREHDGVITHLPWAIPTVSAFQFLSELDIEVARSGTLSQELVAEFIAENFHDVTIPVEDTPPESSAGCEPLAGFVPMSARGRSSLSILPESGTVSAQFLLELCLLARSEQIGMVALTPYRTLVIPNIDPNQRNRWRRLMGRFQLSMCAPEITSQCLVGDNEEARSLARYVLKALVQERCHASGLSIAFMSQAICGEATIRIEKARSRFRCMEYLFPRYDLYSREGSKESSGELRCLQSGLSKVQLIEALKRLIHEFNMDGVQWTESKAQKVVTPNPAVKMCGQCGTHYDPKYGDPMGGIDIGIPFVDLPETWKCPVCESSKTGYTDSEYAVPIDQVV